MVLFINFLSSFLFFLRKLKIILTTGEVIPYKALLIVIELIIAILSRDSFVLKDSLCFLTNAVFTAEDINCFHCPLYPHENPAYAHPRFPSDHQNFLVDHIMRIHTHANAHTYTNTRTKINK